MMTKASFRELFGFPVVDYYRRVGFDLTSESMTDLSAEFHNAYVPGLAACPLHEGVVDALSIFRRAGVRQFVLSAMEETVLSSTVARLGIAEDFEAIYGLDHLEGDSKLDRAENLIDRFGIRPEASVLLGDTDHDADVAESLGLGVALVPTGHQSERRLRATGLPVYVSAREAARALVSPSPVRSGGE